MPSWKICVSTHTIRNLQAIFRAHQWSFNSNWKKGTVLDTMLQNIHGTNWLSVLSQLEPSTMEALKSLFNNPDLPASDFLAQFGPIRPYRPWRDDSPRDPWRNPISPTEDLWYKGLIFRINDSYVLPDPIRHLIPQILQHQNTFSHQGELDRPIDYGNVLADITLFLSLLYRKAIRLLHGRWLPPWALRELGTNLSQPLDLENIRSERQCPQISNLHYLTSVSGLCTPPRFSQKDMASSTCSLQLSAWEWLNADHTQRLRWLWDSWKEDIERSPSLWSLFWPEETIALSEHNAWLTHLAKCPPGTWNNASEIWTFPPPETWFKLMATLGVILIDAENSNLFRITSLGAWLIDPQMSDPIWEETSWSLESGPIVVVPRTDASRNRMILEAFAAPIQEISSPHTLQYQLSPQTIAEGINLGLDLNDLFSALTLGINEPLPKWLEEELAAWHSEIYAVNIERMTILTTDTPSRMELLSRGRPFRRAIRFTLSPRHVVINPNEMPKLVRWLTRQGSPPCLLPTLLSEIRESKSSIHQPEAYYLALATYLNLSHLIDLPVRLPARYLDEIASNMTDYQRENAEATAEEILDRLKAWSKEDLPPIMIADVDEENYMKVLRKAIEKDHTIRIHYWSKGRETPMWRTVEPLRLELSEERSILVGYCHLAKAERHFRLDRMMKLQVIAQREDES